MLELKKYYILLVICLVVLVSTSVFLRINQQSKNLKSTDNTNRILHKTIRKLESTYNFENFKILAKDLLNLIYNRYEMYEELGGKQFFLTANNYGAFHWDILKYKYAIKTLQGNSQFLMIFGGSSVTAGHDNHFNQSYPMIFKKRMQNLFQALGIELIVHNIAQGANNCIPYSFCYESMGGLDPDFIGWEQSYNCGRDESVFELVGRIAGYSKNKALVYYSASGAWLPECPYSKDHPPFCSEDWTPSQASMFVGENVTETSALPIIDTDKTFVEAQKKLLDEYHHARPTASRFIGWANINNEDTYHGVAPHGFNVWEQNSLCKYIKDGKEQQNCNGIDSVMGCKLRFMTAESSVYGSDSGGGARWHPSRAFHMLRGEALTWLYALPMLDAVYMLENDLAGRKNDKTALIEKYSEELEKLHPSTMPNPKKCNNFKCGKRPTCYTNFMPHFPKNMTIKELIVGENNWVYDGEEYPEWSQHYGFLDLKPMYTAPDKDQSDFSIRVTIGDTNEVALCGPNKETYQHAEFLLDQNVKIQGNPSLYKPSANAYVLESIKDLTNDCRLLQNLPQGDHVIIIRVKPSTDGTPIKHLPALSHVITWD